MTNQFKSQFEDLVWHDATLLCINIDRRSPGERDEVALVVEWPDGQRNRLVFGDCYALEAKMNFGIIALESILGATCSSDSPRVEEIRKKFLRYDVNLTDLLCFEIETNSTGGTIRIVARGFHVCEPPDESWFGHEPDDSHR